MQTLRQALVTATVILIFAVTASAESTCLARMTALSGTIGADASDTVQLRNSVPSQSRYADDLASTALERAALLDNAYDLFYMRSLVPSNRAATANKYIAHRLTSFSTLLAALADTTVQNVAHSSNTTLNEIASGLRQHLHDAKNAVDSCVP